MRRDAHRLARTTDPTTSHEAAETVYPSRSQSIVLILAHEYLGPYFTDAGMVETYHAVRHARGLPHVSDSRLRTARRELVDQHRIQHAGYTRPEKGRRHSIWELTE